MDKRRNNNFSLYINSIKIYQWIFCALGIAPPPPLTRSILRNAFKWIISILYGIYCLGFAMVALLYNYFFHGVINRNEGVFQPDTLTNYIINGQAVMLCTLNFATASIVFCKFSSYKSIMQMIAELEYEIKSTHAKLLAINWRLFKASGCPLLIMMSCFICMIYILMSNTLSGNEKVFILYYMAANQTKCIEYGLYIHVVSEFLGHLHWSLKHLMSHAEDIIARGRQPPWSLLCQIIKNQMLLNRLWSLVQTLEEYFAWPILLLFYLNGIAVLAIVNWAYVKRMGDENVVHPYYRITYVIILLTNLCLLCVSAERCIEKYKKISMLIHNFNILMEDRPVLMRLREYSLQMQHQKLLFTCNGYLDVNLSTFGKMMLVIAGYIVIILQFKIEDTISKGSVIEAQHIFGKS